MSFHRPANVAELAQSIRSGHTFRASQFGLRGNSVAVLSSQALPKLDADHELTRRLIDGAREVTRVYLENGSRHRAPSAPVYYVVDVFTGRVVLLVQRDGAVSAELDAASTALRESTRAAMFDAARDRGQAAAAVKPEEEI